MTAETELRLLSIAGIPRVAPGDDIAALLVGALRDADVRPRACDVLIVTSKLLSRVHNRFVDLSSVEPCERAQQLAGRCGKDPRLVELVLRESSHLSRCAPGVLIVRHRLGFVSANAGIDASNAQPPGTPAGPGPWVLLLPEDPNRDAAALREAIAREFDVQVGVVISDSHGRPFRVGSVGVAIGVSGLPPVQDLRGRPDLDGRMLEHTATAVADQVAAAADLIAGQGAESRPVTLLRGLRFGPSDAGADALLRTHGEDLYV